MPTPTLLLRQEQKKSIHIMALKELAKILMVLRELAKKKKGHLVGGISGNRNGWPNSSGS